MFYVHFLGQFVFFRYSEMTEISCIRVRNQSLSSHFFITIAAKVLRYYIFLFNTLNHILQCKTYSLISSSIDTKPEILWVKNVEILSGNRFPCCISSLLSFNTRNLNDHGHRYYNICFQKSYFHIRKFKLKRWLLFKKKKTVLLIYKKNVGF